MSYEAWGSPDDPEPKLCPLCDSESHLDGCELGEMQKRAVKAELEVLEQCRLNGMGSEREARLSAIIEEISKSANKCRLDLLTQINELADHIERAAPSIIDSDMYDQIKAQRDYSLSVAKQWNQNGNPFCKSTLQM